MLHYILLPLSPPPHTHEKWQAKLCQPVNSYDIFVKRACLEDEAATSPNKVFEFFIIKILDHFVDWLAKCIYRYVSFTNNSSQFAVVALLSLLPSVQDRKYNAHLCWGSFRSESRNCLFFAEICEWIAYTQVVYSLYINGIFAYTQGVNESCLATLYDSIISQSKVETL